MTSARSPWVGDRPPHLPCARGELPDAVLFPGDPGRVDRFAALLDDFRVLGQNREFRIGVGRHRGRPIGVCSTGIGGPSTEIALVEAAELGCRTAIRVGGTGALDPAIDPGTLLIVAEALRGGGAAALYAPPDRRARADGHVQRALEASATAAGMPWRAATVASVDGYYAGQGRPWPGCVGDPAERLEAYRQAGAQALDMEAETVLAVGAALGLAAGAVLAVHGNRATDSWLDAFGPAQDRMIRIACDALCALAEGEHS